MTRFENKLLKMGLKMIAESQKTSRKQSNRKLKCHDCGYVWLPPKPILRICPACGSTYIGRETSVSSKTEEEYENRKIKRFNESLHIKNLQKPDAIKSRKEESANYENASPTGTLPKGTMTKKQWTKKNKSNFLGTPKT